VATAEVAKATPDGYTLVFGNIGPNATTHLFRETPYDPIEDFKPISLVARTPLFFSVPKSMPVDSFPEFLAHAKSNPGALNYGSVGVGSFSHLAGEYFKEQAKLNAVHVPYGGGAPMAVALASGDIQFAMVTGLDGGAIMRTGKVKYLAVGAEKSSPALMNLPTIAESVPDYTAVSWFGVLAPSGVPDDIAQKLNQAVVHAVSQPEIQQGFADLNIEAAGTTSEAFADLI